MYKKIIVSLLLCCFLLPFAKGQTTDPFVNVGSISSNTILLTNVKRKTYQYNYKDKWYYPISYKIDWEMIISNAAANLNLKKITLGQKELLFGYALSLEILQHQPKSNFYQKKTYYANLIKQWLTAEEVTYLDAQIAFIEDIFKEKGNMVEWGKFLLEMSPDKNCNYYDLYADTLIAQYYALEAEQAVNPNPISDIDVITPWQSALKFIDAADNEAVIRARWAEQLRLSKQYDKAIYQQEKVYEIRKKRDDYLSYSVSALINIYEEAEQIDKLLDLYKDILSIEKSITTKERKISIYILNSILSDKIRRGLGEEALDEFEFLVDYFPQTDLLTTYNNPYSFYLRMRLSDPRERIRIARRWVASIRSHIDAEKLHCGSLDVVLGVLREDQSKESRIFMQELFESFCFDEQKATAWGQYVNSSGRIVGYQRGAFVNDYWFSMQPYFKSIPLMENNAEKLTLIKRWMEMALRTKQANIITQTASEAAYHLGKIGEGAIADSFFVNYYCEYLSKRDDTREVWINLVPYPGIAKNTENGDKWMNLWGEVALKYATTGYQIYTLRQIAGYYADKREIKKGYEFYDKAILVAQKENEVGEELHLLTTMAVLARRENDPVKSLLTTIRIYDLLPKYCKVYNEGDLCADNPSYLNNAVTEIVKAKNLSKKDKNLILKSLDKWLGRMKGEDYIDMRIFIKSAQNTIKNAWEKG